MNDRQFMRRVAFGIILISIIGPFFVMIWDRKLGNFMFFFGLIIAAGALGVLRMISMEGTRDDIAQTGGRTAHSETGKTIYVSLVDEQGNELPETEAKRRLAEAYAKASPRDTIIPIKERLPE